MKLQPHTYTFCAKLWLYEGKAAWHFVTLPKKYGEEIKWKTAHKRRGWGSVRVVAKIGETEWETSIFPDKKIDSYLLPIKADVRKREELTDGDNVSIRLKIFC